LIAGLLSCSQQTRSVQFDTIWCDTAQTSKMLLDILTLHICQENNMKSTHTIAALVIASTAVLSGCASTSSTPYGYNNSGYNNSGYNSNVSSGYGTIDSIQVVRGQGGTSGSGAVVGGLVGALVGNQVGSGSGRTAATVAGAVGGAAIGNSVEANRNAGGQDMYQINIRMDNGEYRAVTQDSVYDLRVGNRVRMVDGRVYRY
jgi:outer membrane lipoprotein SlyB